MDNILFLTFEESKKNLHETIIKILHFLGPEYENRAADEKYVNEIIKLSSFNEMKKIPELDDKKDGTAFIREGKSGNFAMLGSENGTILKEKYEKCMTDEFLKKLWEFYINE